MTAINEDDTTVLLALDLDRAGARMIAKAVGQAVLKWRDKARIDGVGKSEIDRMASAFEHEERKMARER